MLARKRYTQRHNLNRLATLSSIVGCLFVAPGALAQPAFDNVTATHLNPLRDDPFRSETWGVSIGDIDGDYWSDIYVTNHRNRPTFYRNQGDGTLVDNTLQVDLSRTWLGIEFTDRHGAAFADFDGDGDDDLWHLQARGSTTYTPVLVADDTGRLVDEGLQRGLPDFWGGSSFWLDGNQDGLMDILNSGSRYYPQDASGQFTAPVSLNGCGAAWFAMADFTGDEQPDIVCQIEGTFPYRAYKDLGVYTDIRSQFPTVSNVGDGVAADLNNDLKADLVLMRGALLPNQALQINANRMEAYIDGGGGAEAGFYFTGGGELDLTFYSHQKPLKILVGDSGEEFSLDQNGSITLDPTNTAYHGLVTNRSGKNVYMGYDPANNRWELIQYASTWFDIYVVIESATVLSAVTANTSTGLNERDLPINPAIVMNDGNGAFINATATAGMDIAMQCHSVVAADFDNDMDIDLFTACGGGVENIANRLFVNNGQGVFSEVTNHGGEGVIGKGLLSGTGNGESVVSSDFNNDGFMDVFVTNGINTQPVRTAGGPHELMLNKANANHWIELELVGTGGSNPDAQGARVVAATGGVSQLREQGGGYHRWSQSDDRIHFGLGPNTSVDLDIRWPDGATESFSNVAADAIYLVTQGTGISPAVINAPADYPAPVAGDECGAPAYRAYIDQGVFITRDCTTDIWSLRVIGGATPQALNFAGSIYTDQPITLSGLTSIETDDTVDTSVANQIDFSLNVAGVGEDGFDFELGSGAGACLSLTSSNSARTHYGSQHISIATPYEITSQASCTPPVRSAFSIAPLTFNEADGSVDIVVSLFPSVNTATSVKVATANGSATAGDDFYGSFAELSFPADPTPGELVSQLFTVTLLDDGTVETDEQFLLRLFGASGADIDGDLTAMTIIDDDSNTGPVEYRVAASGFSESAGVADIQITRTSGTSNAGSVIAATTPDSAVGGQDFYGTHSTIAFAAGQTTANFSVTLVDDSVTEADETFNVRLFNAVNGTVPVEINAITIIDDDNGVTPAQFSLSAPASVLEDDGLVDITVTLSKAVASPTQVAFATRAGTATSGGDDFFGVYQQVQFAANQTSATVRVNIAVDSVVEADEQFFVRLFQAQGADLGSISERSIQISNDD